MKTRNTIKSALVILITAILLTITTSCEEHYNYDRLNIPTERTHTDSISVR